MTLKTSPFQVLSEPLIMLPAHPQFGRILATPPPEPDRAKCFVVPKGEQVMRAVGDRELDDYLEGGEYDEHWAECEALDSDILYLPVSIYAACAS